MNKQDIQMLFDNNRWGNARIPGTVAKLSDGQFRTAR
jgi:uncharacterized damage-inducible protein DinB